MGIRLIKLSLYLNYIVFAMILGSIGAVILQSMTTFDLTKVEASVLELFKDLSVIIFTLFIGSYLPRIGIKRSMLIGLALVTIGLLIMPIASAFWATKLLFALAGVAFGLVKVSVMSVMGLVTNTTREHNSLMSSVEGTYMLGLLGGYILFGYFIGESLPGDTSWLNVYWVLASLSCLTFVVVWFAELDESEAKKESKDVQGPAFFAMFRLLLKPIVMFFALSIFTYVLVEQGISTWLPTFNKEVLYLVNSLSVQFVSILAAASAIGRLVAGQLVKHIHWLTLMSGSLFCVALLIVLTLPLTYNLEIITITEWRKAPLAAFTFPLLFFFLSPIYPIINSVVLSSLPKHEHSKMGTLIVLFSALGGTSGSIITAFIFSIFGGQTAFYLAIFPIILLVIYLFMMNKKMNEAKKEAV